MSQLSIIDIIKVGDISNYLSGNYIDKGKVFGDRLSQDMNVTIAMITDALRWQWAAFPDVPEVRAVGRVTIDSIGDDGDNIAVFVNDPDYGIIQLGNYTLTPADTTTQIIATNLGTICQSNTFGYQVILGTSSFQIIGREGTGAFINNANNLFLVITPSPVEFISSENDFRLITQQNLPIPEYITTENN